MRYVLDTFVALKWVLPEPQADNALRLLLEVRLGLHDLVAPDVFPIEVAHALRRAERKRIIRAGDAEGLLARILSAGVNLRPSLPCCRAAQRCRRKHGRLFTISFMYRLPRTNNVRS